MGKIKRCLLLENGEPLQQVSLALFYDPFASSEDVVRETVPRIKEAGFNSIDFAYKTLEDIMSALHEGEASLFVRMTDLAIQQCQDQGLFHSFLALYLNSDNLNPDRQPQRSLY